MLRQSCANIVLFRAIDRPENSTVIIHENDASGLKTHLKLAVGAKVMLRVNVHESRIDQRFDWNRTKNRPEEKVRSKTCS